MFTITGGCAPLKMVFGGACGLTTGGVDRWHWWRGDVERGASDGLGKLVRNFSSSNLNFSLFLVFRSFFARFVFVTTPTAMLIVLRSLRHSLTKREVSKMDLVIETQANYCCFLHKERTKMSGPLFLLRPALGPNSVRLCQRIPRRIPRV